jgi:hypothetical protein
MSLHQIGPIEARCSFCTAWEKDQLPNEHNHVIKIDYDNTCDEISLVLDGKVMFCIELKQWEVIHKQLESLI